MTRLKDLLRLQKPIYLAPVAIALIAVALVRLGWWNYLLSLPGPLGLMAIPFVCIPSIFILTASLIGFLGMAIFTFRRTKSLIPALTLIAGIYFAFQVPLPPRPPTLEMLYFLDTKDDFETVVEMAKRGEIQRSSERCPAGYVPPPEFSHVTPDGCLWISQSEERGWEVEFNPLEPFYHPVVYVEFDQTTYPCPPDTYLLQKIEDHWYVCEHEWN